jgi:hypothetical protein
MLIRCVQCIHLIFLQFQQPYNYETQQYLACAVPLGNVERLCSEQQLVGYHQNFDDHDHVNEYRYNLSLKFDDSDYFDYGQYVEYRNIANEQRYVFFDAKCEQLVFLYDYHPLQ